MRIFFVWPVSLAEERQDMYSTHLIPNSPNWSESTLLVTFANCLLLLLLFTSWKSLLLEKTLNWNVIFSSVGVSGNSDEGIYIEDRWACNQNQKLIVTWQSWKITQNPKADHDKCSELSSHKLKSRNEKLLIDNTTKRSFLLFLLWFFCFLFCFFYFLREKFQCHFDLLYLSLQVPSGRQRSQVVGALDLKSGDPEFKSRSGHQLDLFQTIFGSASLLNDYLGTLHLPEIL